MRHLLILIIFLFSSSCVSSAYNHNKRRLNVKKAYQSVALLSIRNYSKDTALVATGFAYDDDHLITAKHFCIDALEDQIFGYYKHDIKMEYYDEDYSSVVKGNLEVYDVSDIHDICVLKKENHGLSPLHIIENYDKVEIGDEIASVGVPNGRAIGEFGGRVMSPFYYGRGSKKVIGTLLVSSASTGGVSGSPVILTKTGDVIGMVIIVHRYFDHLSYCVSGEVLGEFINSLGLK